eukprot:3034226-Ditylum_brightwellii.AAC.1
MEDPELIESFLNHPSLQAMSNPIMMLNIQQHQCEDLSLNNMRRQNPHSINSRFKAPALRKQCKEYWCGDSQRNKVFGAVFEELPAQHAALTPWSENAIDLIGL